MKNKNKLQRGFTLIEIGIVSVIIVTLGGAALGLQYVLGTSQLKAFDSFVTVDDSITTMRQIAQEIRSARYGDNGAFPIELANDNEIIFYSDYDNDGDTEKIRYYMQNTSLIKEIIEPTSNPVTYPAGTEITREISSNIRNNTIPIFYYFNSNYPADTQSNPLSTPADLLQISMVQIFARINTQEASPDTDYVSNIFVHIRNLKDNL